MLVSVGVSRRSLASLSVLFLTLFQLIITMQSRTLSTKGADNDMYNLGLVFLGLVTASFSEDNLGAQRVRSLLGAST